MAWGWLGVVISARLNFARVAAFGTWVLAPGALLLSLLISGVAYAQVQTGTPPFGSFSGGPFDTVNNANLDVHFAIPIVNKAGRGLPFYYLTT